MSGMSTSRLAGCVAGATAALVIGVGIAFGGGGQHAASTARPLDPTCVLGPDLTSADLRSASPAVVALTLRGDAMDRRNHLGRYGAGGECAHIPAWYCAMVVRGDALDRAHHLGAYARRSR